jgi:hypothetical protein
MKHLEAEDRRECAPPYDPAQVDPEFIPFLERINVKPFVASVQCCVGHCKYPEPGIAPANSAGHWGYLQLLMTGPSAVWLSQELLGREWLIVALSKLWSEKPREMPSYTKRCNFIIAFAWDASTWPTPVEEICSLLDKYHAADPDEPPHLVKFELPQKEGRKKKRPSPTRRKRRR